MSTLEVTPFHGIVLHKSTFTYLLTYLLNNYMRVCEQHLIGNWMIGWQTNSRSSQPVDGTSRGLDNSLTSLFVNCKFFRKSYWERLSKLDFQSNVSTTNIQLSSLQIVQSTSGVVPELVCRWIVREVFNSVQPDTVQVSSGAALTTNHAFPA